jgi:hypothetical protein
MSRPGLQYFGEDQMYQDSTYNLLFSPPCSLKCLSRFIDPNGEKKINYFPSSGFFHLAAKTKWCFFLSLLVNPEGLLFLRRIVK